MMMSYDLFVSRDYLMFSCAHFVVGEKIIDPLHGHNYILQINVFGEQGKNNMVIDFHIIKRVLTPIIEQLDHHVLIPSENPFLEIQETDGQVIVKVTNFHKEYEFPKTDVVLLPIENTTVEEMSHYFVKMLTWNKEFKRDNIERVTVTVYEYERQGVTYELFPRYSNNINNDKIKDKLKDLSKFLDPHSHTS